uniref:Uncharacterized protein n=1 Tax=Arundo donax TaxID=35708 RepID=A0A0A8YH81_ARUDO
MGVKGEVVTYPFLI